MSLWAVQPFDFDNPPRFDVDQQTAVSVFTFCCLVCTSCNHLLCYVYLGRRDSTLKLRATALLALNLTLADAFSGISLAIFYLIKSIAGRYIFGAVGCQVEGFATSFGIWTSIFAVTLLTLERFMTIRLSRTFSQSWWLIAICVTLVVSFLLSLYPATIQGYGMHPSGVICFYKEHPANYNERVYTALLLCVHLINMTIVVSMHTAVFQKVWLIKKESQVAFKDMHEKFSMVNATGTVSFQPSITQESGGDTAKNSGVPSSLVQATSKTGITPNNLAATKNKAMDAEQRLFVKAAGVSIVSLLMCITWIVFNIMQLTSGSTKAMTPLQDTVRIMMCIRAYAIGNFFLAAWLDNIPRTIFESWWWILYTKVSGKA